MDRHSESKSHDDCESTQESIQEPTHLKGFQKSLDAYLKGELDDLYYLVDNYPSFFDNQVSPLP